MAKSSSSSYSELLASSTIRARVAFILTLAEIASTIVKLPSDAVAKRVRDALNLGWRWEQVGDVSAKALAFTVEGEPNYEVGLAFDDVQVSDDQTGAWVTITSAVCYVAWHAYIVSGKRKDMSEVICEVDEDTVDQAVDFAKQMPNFDQAAVDRLVQYCIANHRAADDKDLGAPISRKTMLEVADWAS